MQARLMALEAIAVQSVPDTWLVDGGETPQIVNLQMV